MSKLRSRARVKHAIVKAASWLPFFFGMMCVAGSGVVAQTVGLPPLVDTTNAANISSGTLNSARMCGGTAVANYFCDGSTGLWRPVPWTVSGTNSAVAFFNTFAPAASQSAMLFTGAAPTGTPTTATPLLYFNQAGTTATAWSPSGTIIGDNQPNSFSGYHFAFLKNNTVVGSLTHNGFLTVANGVAQADWGAGYFHAGVVAITPSATPAFSNTVQINTLTLNANVTSSTIAAGQSNGSFTQLHLCQPATGGPFTFTPPTNMLGVGTIGTTAGKCNDQTFWYSTAGAAWYATAPMITNM